MFDGCLSLITCMLVPGLGLVFGIWLFKRLSRRGYQSVIPMDGVTFFQTADGSVTIKKRNLSNWLTLILLGLFELVLLWLTIAGLMNGQALDSRMSSPAFFLAFVIVYLIRTLRTPSVNLNAITRVIEIGNGASRQAIFFSRISQITQTPGQGMKGIRVIRLGMLLDSGEKIELGSVSDSGAVAYARAGTIVRALAKTTGAAIDEQGAAE